MSLPLLLIRNRKRQSILTHHHYLQACLKVTLEWLWNVLQTHVKVLIRLSVGPERGGVKHRSLEDCHGFLAGLNGTGVGALESCVDELCLLEPNAGAVVSVQYIWLKGGCFDSEIVAAIVVSCSGRRVYGDIVFWQCICEDWLRSKQGLFGTTNTLDVGICGLILSDL